MKLKTTPEGHAVVQDGKPVYVNDEGKEIAFDAPATIATISRLNGEAKSNRERYEAAEGKAAAFDGLDPEKARKALDLVANLDAKKLVDAGERDKAIDEAIKAVEKKYQPVVDKSATLERQLNDLLVGGAFASSDFIAKRFLIEGPAGVDQARALFGKHFKVVDGKLVAYDEKGQPLYSPGRPGEYANAEEAIELLVESYPHKKSILRGSGASGGGAGAAPPAGQGQGQGGQRPAFQPASSRAGERAARVADIAARFPNLAKAQ
jgi:hypothetical protein